MRPPKPTRARSAMKTIAWSWTQPVRSPDAIVTWNVRDFPSDGGVRVLTPPELLAELRARSSDS